MNPEHGLPPPEGEPGGEVSAFPETSPELHAERQEVISDIRERHGILFIMAHPRELLTEMGVRGNDDTWFRDGLGMAGEPGRFKTLNALEDDLPDTVEEDGIIISGSNHAVYEDAPWIRRLEDLIREMASQGKPILGVCFGHQLIAKAYGGRVERGPAREIGVVNLELTEAGKRDPLFRDLPESFKVGETHGDVVTEPPLVRTALLAHNDVYPAQAIGIGENVRGTQFHPEIPREQLAQVVRYRIDELAKSGETVDSQAIEEIMQEIHRTSEIEAVGRQVLRNFMDHFVVSYNKKRNG
jgi:GMP synthase (glutamine-hydrolysing)